MFPNVPMKDKSVSWIEFFHQIVKLMIDDDDRCFKSWYCRIDSFESHFWHDVMFAELGLDAQASISTHEYI